MLGVTEAENVLATLAEQLEYLLCVEEGVSPISNPSIMLVSLTQLLDSVLGYYLSWVLAEMPRVKSSSSGKKQKK